MSLKGDAYFQREMSLNGSAWIDHPEHGDRYERSKIDDAGAAPAVSRRYGSGGLQARAGRHALCAHRRRATTFPVRWPQASGEGPRPALPGADHRLFSPAADPMANPLPGPPPDQEALPVAQGRFRPYLYRSRCCSAGRDGRPAQHPVRPGDLYLDAAGGRGVWRRALQTLGGPFGGASL